MRAGPPALCAVAESSAAAYAAKAAAGVSTAGLRPLESWPNIRLAASELSAPPETSAGSESRTVRRRASFPFPSGSGRAMRLCRLESARGSKKLSASALPGTGGGRTRCTSPMRRTNCDRNRRSAVSSVSSVSRSSRLYFLAVLKKARRGLLRARLAGDGRRDLGVALRQMQRGGAHEPAETDAEVCPVIVKAWPRGWCDVRGMWYSPMFSAYSPRNAVEKNCDAARAASQSVRRTSLCVPSAALRVVGGVQIAGRAHEVRRVPAARFHRRRCGAWMPLTPYPSSAASARAL